MFTEDVIPVSADPEVALFVAHSAGPADRTLLVVHGGPDWDHSYLREPLADAANRLRLILPDLRGCGRSTRALAEPHPRRPVRSESGVHCVGCSERHFRAVRQADDQYTPDAVVADLIALLDVFGVARADVLGFSYGGLIAQRLALTAPDRVRRLVVASSSVLPVPADAFDGWTERDERLAGQPDVWNDPGLSGPERTRAAAVASARADVWRPEALPGYLRRIAAVEFSGEWARPWLAGTLPSPRVEDPAGRLAALGIPVLLLHGRQDMTFPAVLAEQAAALIPSARAVVLDQAGHMAHVDQPQAWLVAVEDFLAG